MLTTLQNAPSIILNNVSFSYRNSLPLLKNLSLQITAGTFLGIIGANGSGKSTLLQLLNGLIPNMISGKLSGEILIDGINTKTKPVNFFAKKVGMLFQNPDFSLFNLTVKEEIEFGLKNLKLPHDTAVIANALTAVNLSGFAERDPQTLSLGEKQKLCLGCVLALNPDYIALDEPIATLDYKSSTEIYALLQQLNQQGKTIIAIEHDTDYLWLYAKEIVVLNNGEIVAHDMKEKILTNKKLLQQLGLKIPNCL